MVYDKKRSGDPDYDDKVPPAQHGVVKKAPDGTQYMESPSTGPVNLDGSHFNLDDHNLADAAGDNRPAPGQVATEASVVQQYDPADAPHAEGTGIAEPDTSVPWTPDETPASTPGAPGENPNQATAARPAKSTTASTKRNQ